MLDCLVDFATLIILSHAHFIELNIRQMLRCFEALIDESFL
jgi:hypothetical protein